MITLLPEEFRSQCFLLVEDMLLIDGMDCPLEQAVLPLLPLHALGERVPARILCAPGSGARQDHVQAPR